MNINNIIITNLLLVPNVLYDHSLNKAQNFYHYHKVLVLAFHLVSAGVFLIDVHKAFHHKLQPCSCTMQLPTWPFQMLKNTEGKKLLFIK